MEGVWFSDGLFASHGLATDLLQPLIYFSLDEVEDCHSLPVCDKGGAVSIKFRFGHLVVAGTLLEDPLEKAEVFITPVPGGISIAALHLLKIKNYFTSSDPHRDIILKHICHKF